MLPELFRLIDATSNSGRGVGAGDWARSSGAAPTSTTTTTMQATAWTAFRGAFEPLPASRLMSLLFRWSCAQLTGQVVEVARRHVDRRISLQIGLSIRPELERPGDEGRPQPHTLGCTQVAEMGGHHHDFVGLEVEKIGGGLVDLAV